jgi:undecaprenyl phosphate N,N'-diacetylbacillosamine 1-phosphate transferase
MGAWCRRVKRLLDLTLTTLMLLLTLPVLVLCALVIKLEDRGPVFFRQERIGRGGAPFRVWKFRTMIPNAQAVGLKHTVAANDERITCVGKVLRNFGLDELPQLLNVLAGEMSLVGPRPTLEYQVDACFNMKKLGARLGKVLGTGTASRLIL